MDWQEFRNDDGIALAELVRQKEVQAKELVEAAIQGIEKWNPA